MRIEGKQVDVAPIRRGEGEMATLAFSPSFP